MTAGRGHRALAHTADTIVEAWGPTLDACLEEAVTCLVEGFADITGARAADEVEADLDASSPERLLEEVLEEVIYRLDVSGTVPVTVSVERGRVTFGLAPLDAVEAIGPEPKAVALSGLSCAVDDEGTWRATATIDV